MKCIFNCAKCKLTIIILFILKLILINLFLLKIKLEKNLESQIRLKIINNKN